jgi:DNA-binding CsgD family transcriptional regulator
MKPMYKSRQPSLTELRQVFRLVGECRDLGFEADAWRRHAFERMTLMLRARAATGGEVHWARPDGVLTFVHPVVTGFAPSEIAVFARYMRARSSDPAAGDPILRPLGRSGGKLVTRTRQQLVRDHAWYRSLSFNDYRRVVGVDHCVYSLRALPGENSYSFIGLHRELGERIFGPRERRLLHICHDELGRLTGTILARKPELAQLSPRLRQTLDALLRGDSEKQVASRLRLSRPTVHEYVTALYRHFGVSSRAELLARFIRRPPLSVGNSANRGGSPK